MESFDDFNTKFNRSRQRRLYKPRRRRKRKPLFRRNKLTMYDYLASSVPADVSFTINKFGRFKKARNEKELAEQLKSFVNMFGDKAIMELAKIHPDKKLIEAGCSKCEEVRQRPAPKPYHPFVNAEGVVAGTPTTSNESEEKEKQTKKLTTNMLIIGGFMVMSFALIMKK